jgi:hypothetical protein
MGLRGPNPINIDARFWAKVKLEDEIFPENGCMIWTATLSERGYPIFTDNGKRVSASRWIYKRIRGPIAEGETLVHLCKNLKCVNPDHAKLKPKMDLDERFWSHVQFECEVFPENGCMFWISAKDSDGYPVFTTAKRLTARRWERVSAYRWIYERLRGPISNKFELDHLCKVKHCVNPDHLEAVTHAENVKRGSAARLKTHCKNGHPFSEENTIIWADGTRRCRQCYRVKARLYMKERRKKHGLDSAND